MIGVTENDLRLQLAQLTRTHRFDASLRPHWDERRCFNDAVRSCQPSMPRLRFSILRKNFERLSHSRMGVVQHHFASSDAMKLPNFLRSCDQKIVNPASCACSKLITLKTPRMTAVGTT